jgi:hypothetical protein
VPKNTRFAINYFTSIGLGVITEEMREYLKVGFMLFLLLDFEILITVGFVVECTKIDYGTTSYAGGRLVVLLRF